MTVLMDSWWLNATSPFVSWSTFFKNGRKCWILRFNLRKNLNVAITWILIYSKRQQSLLNLFWLKYHLNDDNHRTCCSMSIVWIANVDRIDSLWTRFPMASSVVSNVDLFVMILEVERILALVGWLFWLFGKFSFLIWINCQHKSFTHSSIYAKEVVKCFYRIKAFWVRIILQLSQFAS
jgi:hypothetical protein